MTILQIEKRRE